jgi:hypothetical protein
MKINKNQYTPGKQIRKKYIFFKGDDII